MKPKGIAVAFVGGRPHIQTQTVRLELWGEAIVLRQRNDQIGAFVSIDAEQARALAKDLLTLAEKQEAKAAEQATAQINKALGGLHGE